MIIGIWIATVIFLAIVLGEVRYYYEMKKVSTKNQEIFSQIWSDNIDRDIDILGIEQSESDFVSSRMLARRGSWRLAQNQVMGVESFESMKMEEYCRKL